MTSGTLRPAATRATDRLSALARRIGLAPPLLLLAVLAPAPRGPAGQIAGLPSLCTFHNVTGLPCLGCGMTRAVVCLAHGRVADAVIFHPLGPLVFATLAFFTLSRAAELVRPGWALRLPRRLIAGSAWTCLALLGLVWTLRLAGWLPAPP